MAVDIFTNKVVIFAPSKWRNFNVTNLTAVELNEFNFSLQVFYFSDSVVVMAAHVRLCKRKDDDEDDVTQKSAHGE